MAAFLLLSACAHDEDDLFPESAAQRINHSVAEWKQILTDNDNCWVMEYVPADGYYGGYLYTVKLTDEDATIGTVDITFTNSGYTYPPGTERTSKYSVKAEQGVILSFDTYSPFFHHFSEPKGSSAPDGYQGDYEFVLDRTSADGDTIYMTGKKYGNDIRMYKLRGMDRKEFVDEIVNVRNGLYSATFQSLQVGDSTYQVTIGRNLVVTDTVSSENTTTPIFLTPDGFHLYHPITLNGKTFQDFHSDNNRESLVADNDVAEIKYGISAKEQIEHPKGYGLDGNNIHYNWTFRSSQMDDESRALYNYLLTHTDSPDYAGLFDFEGLQLGSRVNIDMFYRKNARQTLSIYWTFFGFAYVAFFNGVTYTYNPDDETLSITSQGTEYYSGEYYHSYYTNHVVPLFKRIIDNSPYKVTLNDFFIKTHMKLESINNPSVYYGLDLLSSYDNED